MSQTGVEITGPVQAGTITISGVTVGLTAPEVKELTKAAAAGAVGPLADKIIDLSQRLGVTQGAMRTMLATVGQAEVPEERLPDTLAAFATEFLAMRQALVRPANEDKDNADLRRQAIAALDEGAFNDAKRLLNDIRARERVVSEQRRRRAEEERADWIAALQAEAETCALLARAELAQGNVAGASAHFDDGLSVLAPADPGPRWSYALEVAATLFEFGDLAGRNDALAAAIGIYRRALADAPRERVPLDWAMTKTRLCNALRKLGERESGTARLQEAVDAYRAALEEGTRERCRSTGRRRRTTSAPRCDARETGGRDGAPRGGGGGLPRGAAGTDARARAARLGDDAEQPRRCALDARGTRERDGAARGGGGGLPRGAAGTDA